MPLQQQSNSVVLWRGSTSWWRVDYMTKPFLFVEIAYLRSHIHSELFLRSYIKVETFLRSYIRVETFLRSHIKEETFLIKDEMFCMQIRSVVPIQASESLSTGGRQGASDREFRRHCDFNIASMKRQR